MTMTTGDLEVVNNEAEGRFEVGLGDAVAVLAYRIEGSKLLFLHTRVPDQFSGRGVGSLLARTGLEYAKEHGLRAVPHCPYVAAYITRHPEWEAITDRP